MIGRLTCAAIIVLMVFSSGVAAVRADDNTTPLSTMNASQIVITDDIQPYFGPMGPDSPLYGLRIAFENLDEAFTFNTSEKVMKQMEHAEFRIAEIKGLLLMNRSAEAERALDAYFEKMNLTELEISSFPVRTTGIARAYQEHVKHELALRDLIQLHPNSTGLWRAYNHTVELEETFAEKCGQRIEKLTGQLNHITARFVWIANRTENQTPYGEMNRGQPRWNVNRTQDQGEVQGSATHVPVTPGHGEGREKQVEGSTGAAPVTTPTTTQSPEGSERAGERDRNGKGQD
jgi:hypothetical protein